MEQIWNSILLEPLYNVLVFLVAIFPGHSLGWAVIVLTIVVKVALLPTTKAMTRQQALLAKLKPEIDAIQAKYKDDKVKQGQAVNAFYKKHHINPLGSCLPLIIQLVVLLVLYYVFRIGVTTERFDLLYSFTPRPETINQFFFGVDLSKPDKWILPIIAGALQFVQSYQMMPKAKGGSEDPSAAMQRQMTFVFPLISIWVARSFPAALPLYWSVSSIISIAQQAYILRQTKDITPQVADELLEEEVGSVEELEEKTHKKGVQVTVRKKK